MRLSRQQHKDIYLSVAEVGKKDISTYTESPFMNISGLSLITLVRTQESKFFIVNWLKKRMTKIISNTPLEQNYMPNLFYV